MKIDIRNLIASLLIAGACFALLLGLLAGGGAGPIALSLVSLGAGLMVGACVAADFLWN